MPDVWGVLDLMHPDAENTLSTLSTWGDELDLLGFELMSIDDGSGVLTLRIRKVERRRWPGFIQGDEDHFPVKPRKSWRDRFRELTRRYY